MEKAADLRLHAAVAHASAHPVRWEMINATFAQSVRKAEAYNSKWSSQWAKNGLMSPVSPEKRSGRENCGHGAAALT